MIAESDRVRARRAAHAAHAAHAFAPRACVFPRAHSARAPPRALSNPLRGPRTHRSRARRQDGSGTIAFDTFQKVMSSKMHTRDPKDEAVKAFRLFDDDETGTISLKNLRRVAKELGENMTDDELQVTHDPHHMTLIT